MDEWKSVPGHLSIDEIQAQSKYLRDALPPKFHHYFDALCRTALHAAAPSPAEPGGFAAIEQAKRMSLQIFMSDVLAYVEETFGENAMKKIDEFGDQHNARMETIPSALPAAQVAEPSRRQRRMLIEDMAAQLDAAEKTVQPIVKEGSIDREVTGTRLGWGAWAMLRASIIAVIEAECSPAQVAEPVAWMVPHLLDVHGAERTSLPKEHHEEWHGTVAWSAEVFSDGDGVIDKHGVLHRPKPLGYIHASDVPTQVSAQSEGERRGDSVALRRDALRMSISVKMERALLEGSNYLLSNIDGELKEVIAALRASAGRK